MPPIYEYESSEPARACDRCQDRFEILQKMSDKPLDRCPKCGGPVQRLISAPSVGASQSNFDDRAKSAGFHKLKRLGRGEYEKQY